MEFGEFVAVDAVGELAERRGQREDGHLHHVVVVGVMVDGAETEWMNEVFGVVCDEDLEAAIVLLSQRLRQSVRPEFVTFASP